MSTELAGSFNSQSASYPGSTHGQPVQANGQVHPVASSSVTDAQVLLGQQSSSSNAPPQRTDEERECAEQTAARIRARLSHDHKLVTNPDVDTPFIDQEDVINRLLPYHVYQQPQDDLEAIIDSKGKGRAVDGASLRDIQETKTALECYKRRETLLNRWRKVKVRAGKRPAPDDQAYFLAQVVLESDRSENAWLTSELRTARSEADRLDRERKAAASAAHAATAGSQTRQTQFSAVPQTAMPATQPSYYRGYPYAYAQPYGSMAAAPAMTTFPAAPPPPTTYVPYQASGAIPVQLPVASLSALHALGIVPIPAESLLEGQPPPPAVLRRTLANGTILSLEINVSSLQSVQMSGLAVLLNSLVSRSTSTSTPSSQTPATSASGPAANGNGTGSSKPTTT